MLPLLLSCDRNVKHTCSEREGIHDFNQGFPTLDFFICFNNHWTFAGFQLLNAQYWLALHDINTTFVYPNLTFVTDSNENIGSGLFSLAVASFQARLTSIPDSFTNGPWQKEDHMIKNNVSSMGS